MVIGGERCGGDGSIVMEGGGTDGWKEGEYLLVWYSFEEI